MPYLSLLFVILSWREAGALQVDRQGSSAPVPWPADQVSRSRLAVHFGASCSTVMRRTPGEGQMRFTLAILCTFACGTSALAQYGVSNARDGSGNLIRSTGSNEVKSYDRSPGPIGGVPAPPPPTNPHVNNKNTSK
jgi:hypothetical protein